MAGIDNPHPESGLTKHQRGIALVDALVAEFGIEPVAHELRWFASEHLHATHTDLDEIGTSDVSIHLADLANHQPELLREEAGRLRERTEMVRNLAARTGRSEADTLRGLQALFAPAATDEGTSHARPPTYGDDRGSNGGFGE